jgi:hypothetical protein
MTDRVHEATYLKCEFETYLLFQHNIYYMLNITEHSCGKFGVYFLILWISFNYLNMAT